MGWTGPPVTMLWKGPDFNWPLPENLVLGQQLKDVSQLHSQQVTLPSPPQVVLLPVDGLLQERQQLLRQLPVPEQHCHHPFSTKLVHVMPAATLPDQQCLSVLCHQPFSTELVPVMLAATLPEQQCLSVQLRQSVLTHLTSWGKKKLCFPLLDSTPVNSVFIFWLDTCEFSVSIFWCDICEFGVSIFCLDTCEFCVSIFWLDTCELCVSIFWLDTCEFSVSIFWCDRCKFSVSIFWLDICEFCVSIFWLDTHEFRVSTFWLDADKTWNTDRLDDADTTGNTVTLRHKQEVKHRLTYDITWRHKSSETQTKGETDWLSTWTRGKA